MTEVPNPISSPEEALLERKPFIRRAELALIGVIIILDQLTKFAVRAVLPLHDSRRIIPNLLDFTHV